MKIEMDNAVDILHNRNLKATPTRLKLLKEMYTFGGAMPLSIIQTKLRKTDRVTLYRTIQTLTDKGIIHKAHEDQEETYYAICGRTCTMSKHNHEHIHFRCTRCDSIRCVPWTEDFNIMIPGCKIDKIQTYIEGVCRRCNE